MRAAAIAILALLIAPASALAGGFATVGVSSLPDGTAPGEPWVVELTILQHGRAEAPVDGLRPAILVSGTGYQRAHRALPTGRPGVYRARVVFPDSGTWNYTVEDGFGGLHTYPAVEIGATAKSVASPAPAPAAPTPPSGGGPNVALALLAAAVAALAAAAGTRLLTRRARLAAGGPARA